MFSNKFQIYFLILAIPIQSTLASVNDSDYEYNDGFTFLVSGGFRYPEMQMNARYIVSIRSRTPRKYFGDNHFCAGSIIRHDIVLTAAHCVMDKRKVLTRARRLLIVAGTPNRLRIDPTTIQFPVESVTAHPRFIRYSSSDLAIIRIKGTIPDDNEMIKIIALASKPPPYDQNCLTIGWGRLYYDGPLSAATTHVRLNIYPQNECKKKHPHYIEGVLCAGDRVRYNEDPCRGDSGGPLICSDELTGVVSWTIGCGSKYYPSLYTDVYYHRKWIEEAINRGYVHVAPSFIIMYIFVAIAIV